ncbi:hypothetical protein Hanom_Chr12g01175171 [Helianthus anomalus]
MADEDWEDSSKQGRDSRSSLESVGQSMVVSLVHFCDGGNGSPMGNEVLGVVEAETVGIRMGWT